MFFKLIKLSPTISASILHINDSAYSRRNNWAFVTDKGSWLLSSYIPDCDFSKMGHKLYLDMDLWCTNWPISSSTSFSSYKEYYLNCKGRNYIVNTLHEADFKIVSKPYSDIIEEAKIIIRDEKIINIFKN